MAMRLAGQLPVEALQLSPIWRCNILQKYFATFAKKYLQKTISNYLDYCKDIEKSHYSKWNNDSHELFACQEKDLRMWIKILDSTEELFRVN